MTKDDRTVFRPAHAEEAHTLPSVDVHVLSPADSKTKRRFRTAFTIGRGGNCPVQIKDEGVSRQHVEVFFDGGGWWVRDLNSSNGTFVAGRPITELALIGATTLELGHEGPLVRIFAPTEQEAKKIERGAQTPGEGAVDSEQERTDDAGTQQGDDSGTKKQIWSLRFSALFGLLLILLFAVAGTAFFFHQKLEKTTQLANEIFYDMKEMEVQILSLEGTMDAAASEALRQHIAESKRKLVAMRKRYDIFVKEIRESRLRPPDDVDLLILNIARVFGETELDVPKDFVKEVKSYIQKWKSSPRLERAIDRLYKNGYARTIVKALEDNGLPPQFIYLALQETNFRPRAVGPPTRYGHAKGMWQFIPATGIRYGLRPGPLKNSGKYDPEDERHDFAKATQAAARYLKDIYRTDAQASGLLVMASYNWGEGNIIKRIRKMPKNSRERNFWALLRHHKIPKETYSYVFYIFSAAVICENPRLFGFEFDNPLHERTAPGRGS